MDNYKAKRKHRANTENIFLKEIKELDDYTREFNVVGSTGNNYKVTVGRKITCQCPDFTGKSMQRQCKHIYYILNKILNCDSSMEDKDEYTNDDLDILFNRNKPTVVAEEPIIDDEDIFFADITPNDSNFELPDFGNMITSIMKYIPCFYSQNE